MANAKLNNHLKFLFGILLLSSSNADSGFPVKKCSITDEPCFNSLFHSILDHLTKDGAPELGMPDTDPYKITDSISIPFLNSLNITTNEGTIEGFNTCVYERNLPDMDRMIIKQVMTCDTKINCKFVVTGKNPFKQTFLGNDDLVDGKGNVDAKIDKIRLDIEIPFKIKQSDGENYLSFLEQEPHFDYTVQKVTMTTSDVIVANQDFSAFINAYFNENWEMIMKNFGQDIVSLFLKIYLNVSQKLFNAYSLDQFVIEDVSQYASKD